MKPKVSFNLIVILAVMLTFVPALVVAAPQGSEKIEPQLLDLFAVKGSGDFIAHFAEQADLSAAYDMDWVERGRFVYDTLKATAERTQVGAKAILDGRGLKYQTFIAGNELYVFAGNQPAAEALAALPEVTAVVATKVREVPKPEVGGDAPEGTLAWGMTDTGADDFWAQFGVAGDGMVVANIDTGVDYTHEALLPNYKCGSAGPHTNCWLDPGTADCSGPGGGPCDTIYSGIYHGSHTMGTMVGDDDPALTYNVGMAPNAQWIACMGCPSGSCPDFDLNTCADWMLAPGGSADNRPNVVNNSWGGTPDGDPWYLSKVNAWRAAGIFPAFSAGNSGSSCDSMGDPGSYQESFASAAHDSSRTIAGFSSRGPSAFGHDPYTKPNISAPGVSVMSTRPGDAYETMSGTSMASPHVAGAVALLWSCNPSLVGQIDTTFQLLQGNTDSAPAGNCGAPPDGEGNYTFGYGYLNIYQVGLNNCGGDLAFGAIEGHVYDTGGTPVEGATVSASPALAAGSGPDAITDPSGYYTMTVLAGTYNMTASKIGYTPDTASGVVVITDTVTTQDFELEWQGQWTAMPAACFDLTRIDAEYFPATGLIYILGGRGGASGADTISTIYSYDPATGTCLDTGADMPDPISNYTINAVNNGTADVLCTFGGRAADASVTLSVQCYDPIANTATIVGNLPAAYSGFTPGGQAVVDNMVYVFGGFNSTASPYELSRTDRYDPVANTFTQVGNLSQARSYLQVAVVDGAIYAFGGTVFDGTNLTAQTRAEVMADPGGAGTWDDAAVTDLPTAGAEGRAWGYEPTSIYGLANQIVIAGGGQWPSETADALLYDIETDTYDYNFPDLVNARRDHGGAFVPTCTPDLEDGLPGMWVFGGRQGVDTPPYMVPEFYPLACAQEGPQIEVSVSALSAEMCEGGIGTQTFEICNVGTEPLDWTMSELSETVKIAARQPAVRPAGQRVELTLEAAGGASVETNPVAPDAPVVLVLDDGSRDNDIGLGGTIEMLWVNRFTPLAGEFPFELTQIQIYFSSVGLVNVGDDIVLLVYENTTGNTDPAVGSNLLATFPVTVQALDTWNVYDLATPVVLNGPGDVVVGAIGMETPGTDYWPASIDQTATQARSWAGWWNASPPPTPPVLPPENWTLIDAYFPGNWMVRGYGETIVAYDVPWLSEDPILGTLPAGECQEVVVTFDSTGLLPGTYTAGLFIESNDEDDPEITIPVTMTVNEALEASFTWDPAAPMVSEPVMFTDTTTGPAAVWLWELSDGYTYNIQNPTHTFMDAGTFTVTLTVTSTAGCADTYSAQVTVEPLPPQFNFYLPIVVKNYGPAGR